MEKLRQLQKNKAAAKTSALALLAAAETANREFTTDEQAQYDALKASIVSLDKQIAMAEERVELERGAAAAAFEATRDPGSPLVGGVRDRAEDNPAPFKTSHDFLSAVMGAGKGARLDDRLRRFAGSSQPGYRATQGSDEQSTLQDPYGGFLVPVSVMPGVLMVSAEQDPLAALTTNLPMATPSVKLNARVDKDHSSSVSGGLTVARRPELSDGAGSRMEFEPVNMDARDLFGLCYATENILEDSPESFYALLQAGFGDEFANNRMNERINGNGGGEYLGILNAPCVVSVAKETNQAAATIVKENIDKMASRCWRYGQAVWLANQNTRPQLKSLVQVVGTGGNAVPYFVSNPDGTGEALDGRPIFFTEWCKTLGTVGDLILGNWSQYLEGEYRPMRAAESIHVRFLANERAFKFWKRTAGQPWWKSVLTPKNGSTLAPFVTVATRA